MDEATRTIAAYAAELDFTHLPASTVHAAKRQLVDTVACAIAGAGCAAARIGLAIAAGAAPAQHAGRVLVHGARTTAEAAAFINGAMIRYLDFNDAVNGGHPSDAMGAVFALAEAAGADGKRLISAMVTAYETGIRLISAARLRTRGWDQGFPIGIAAAAAAGHLLRLPREPLAHAIAITAVANVPLRATRAGPLSNWKGAATAFAARNGVFAAQLAAAGLTGPAAPFSGRNGVIEQLGGEFAPESYEAGFRIEQVATKYSPLENNAQAAVWAARALRERVPLDRLAAVEIATTPQARNELGAAPAKWDPRTREEADHSLPFIFARAFVDGGITVASFAEKAYLDPALRPLMAKIAVTGEEAIDRVFPDTVLMPVTATDTAGVRHRVEIANPRGHCRNPMDDGEIAAKFLTAAEPVLGRKAAAALDCLWAIEREPGLARFHDLLEAK